MSTDPRDPDDPAGARDAPWWETGASPEPVFRSARRRQWVLLAAAVVAVLFLAFFVWVGTKVGAE